MFFYFNFSLGCFLWKLVCLKVMLLCLKHCLCRLHWTVYPVIDKCLIANNSDSFPIASARILLGYFIAKCTHNGTTNCRTVYVLELHGLVTSVSDCEVFTFKYLSELFCHLAYSHRLDLSWTTSGLYFIWPKEEQWGFL